MNPAEPSKAALGRARPLGRWERVRLGKGPARAAFVSGSLAGRISQAGECRCQRAWATPAGTPVVPRCLGPTARLHRLSRRGQCHLHPVRAQTPAMLGVAAAPGTAQEWRPVPAPQQTSGSWRLQVAQARPTCQPCVTTASCILRDDSSRSHCAPTTCQVL